MIELPYSTAGFAVGAIGVGSLPGILLGSHLASRVPERVLCNSLAAVLLLAGGKLVLN